MKTRFVVYDDSRGKSAAAYEAMTSIVHLGAEVELRTGFVVEAGEELSEFIERLLKLSGARFDEITWEEPHPLASSPEQPDAWFSGPNEWTEPGDPAQAAEPLPYPSPISKEDIREGEEGLVACAHCGEAFAPKRKSSLPYCAKAECQRAKNRVYQQRWAMKKRESEELPESVEDDPKPVQGLVWLIEDGPEKNKRLTTAELRKRLINGNMANNQHVRHVENGQHKVVKCNGSPSQKLERLFGEDGPYYVLAGEL